MPVVVYLSIPTSNHNWHPQCRCYIVPVLADEKDRMAYHRAVLNGEDVEGWKFEGEIAEPHAGFQKWMKDNADRVEKAAERGTLPYWVKDNPQYVGMKQAAQAESVKDIHDQRDTASHSIRDTSSKETPTDSSRAAVRTAQKELVEWNQKLLKLTAEKEKILGEKNLLIEKNKYFCYTLL